LYQKKNNRLFFIAYKCRKQISFIVVYPDPLTSKALKVLVLRNYRAGAKKQARGFFYFLSLNTYIWFTQTSKLYV